MLQVLLPWGGCGAPGTLASWRSGEDVGGRWAPRGAPGAGVVWRGLGEWWLLLAALAGYCVQEEHSTSGFLMSGSVMASLSVITS